MTNTKPTTGDITDLAFKIIGKEKTGSALEAHEIKLIWDLGDLLHVYCNSRPFHIVLDVIKKEWTATKRGKFDSRLYRGALTVRNYWADKEDYLITIKSLNSWGKLREVIPLLDLVLTGEKITRQDIDELVHQARNRTYPELRDLVKILRLKGDPVFEELGIDIYELEKELYEVNADLINRLEKNDQEFYAAFRTTFDENKILAVRKCLSGLQNDEVYLKYKTDIKEFSKQTMTDTLNPELTSLSKLIGEIVRLTVSEAGRKKIREEVGIRLFGDLSTYLKALSSDENRDRFLKNQEVLKAFLGGMQS